MPIPLLALAAVSAAPKLYQAYKQGKAADAVKLQNTTTSGEREQLGMSRQAAATSARGFGAQQTRLGQARAVALQDARLGAGSASDFLAAASAAAARQQRGELQLGLQGAQYQDRAAQQLRQDLTAQSQRERRDLDSFNKEKGALTQAAAENLNNGLSTLASYGAYSNNADAMAGGSIAERQAKDAEIGADRLDYTARVAGPDNLNFQVNTPPPQPLPAQLPYYQGPNGAPNLNRYRFGLGGGRYAGRQQRYGF